MKYLRAFVMVATLGLAPSIASAGSVKPGDLITPDNASAVADRVTGRLAILSGQTALVDEDIQSGFSSVVYMPGHESEEHESWYINMGIATKAFLDPHQMQNFAR